MNEQTVRISGMTCGACVTLITRMLSRMEGVNSVISVDPQGVARVSVDAKFTKDAYAKALSGTFYTVESVS